MMMYTFMLATWYWYSNVFTLQKENIISSPCYISCFKMLIIFSCWIQLKQLQWIKKIVWSSSKRIRWHEILSETFSLYFLISIYNMGNVIHDNDYFQIIDATNIDLFSEQSRSVRLTYSYKVYIVFHIYKQNMEIYKQTLFDDRYYWFSVSF